MSKNVDEELTEVLISAVDSQFDLIRKMYSVWPRKIFRGYKMTNWEDMSREEIEEQFKDMCLHVSKETGWNIDEVDMEAVKNCIDYLEKEVNIDCDGIKEKSYENNN